MRNRKLRLTHSAGANLQRGRPFDNQFPVEPFRDASSGKDAQTRLFTGSSSVKASVPLAENVSEAHVGPHFDQAIGVAAPDLVMLELTKPQNLALWPRAAKGARQNGPCGVFLSSNSFGLRFSKHGTSYSLSPI